MKRLLFIWLIIIFSFAGVEAQVIGCPGTAPSCSTIQAGGLLFPLENDAATPTIRFGDGDSGFYESADDVLRIAIGGVATWYITGGATGILGSSGTSYPALLNKASTATVPNLLPRANVTTTGIGAASDTSVSIIANSLEGLRVAESSGVFTATLGSATADDVQHVFSIVSDADSDAGGDTDDTFSITLTPNADPTNATWGFTSTQSGGYTFDKTVTVSGAAVFNGSTFLGNAVTDGITAAGAFQEAAALYFDGATNDTVETILGITDPTTADKTVTLPDATGDVAVVSLQGSVATTTDSDTTDDITGTSTTTLTADVLTGRTYEWTAVGTITGANGVKTFHLWSEDASILNVATQAGTAGDFKLVCTYHIVAESNDHDAFCELTIAAGADEEFDYANVTTKDLSDGGVLRLQQQLAHADDEIKTEYTRLVIHQ
jgi:hypothetical protein